MPRLDLVPKKYLEMKKWFMFYYIMKNNIIKIGFKYICYYLIFL